MIVSDRGVLEERCVHCNGGRRPEPREGAGLLSKPR